MILLNTNQVSKAFGVAPLFRNVSLSIREGDRLGLIGPNVPQNSHFAPGETPRTVMRRTLALALNHGRAGFRNFDADTETLSGGWRKPYSGIGQRYADSLRSAW
jgi:ATP-binding cassette subfamily F protein uup